MFEQISKNEKEANLKSEIKETFGFSKKDIEKYNEYIDDSTTHYLNAFDDLKKEFEKIKSLISESGILTINLHESNKEAKSNEQNYKAHESKINLTKIFSPNHIHQNQITTIKNEYQRTFAKLEYMRVQLDIIDKQNNEKKKKLSKLQTNFEGSFGDADKVKQTKDITPKEHPKQQLPTQTLQSDEINAFEMYSEGIRNYFKWLNSMVLSYYQSINDINTITQSQNQIITSGRSLQKNFDNLFGFYFPLFPAPNNQIDSKEIEKPTHMEKSTIDPFDGFFGAYNQSVQNMTELGSKFLESWMLVFKNK